MTGILQQLTGRFRCVCRHSRKRHTGSSLLTCARDTEEGRKRLSGLPRLPFPAFLLYRLIVLRLSDSSVRRIEKSSYSLPAGFVECRFLCCGDYFLACQLFLFYLQVREVDVECLFSFCLWRCLPFVGASFGLRGRIAA